LCRDVEECDIVAESFDIVHVFGGVVAFENVLRRDANDSEPKVWIMNETSLLL
jgi:hypothetical protein